MSGLSFSTLLIIDSLTCCVWRSEMVNLKVLLYMPIADTWRLYDNPCLSVPELIATGEKAEEKR